MPGSVKVMVVLGRLEGVKVRVVGPVSRVQREVRVGGVGRLSSVTETSGENVFVGRVMV